VLTTTSISNGNIWVRAVIKNGLDFDYDYIQDFYIKIDYFNPVDLLYNFPTQCSIGNYTLYASVSPSNATNKTIIWEVKDAGGTGAVINGDVLTTTAPGTVTITAIIKDGNLEGDYDYPDPDPSKYTYVDYREDFSMVISP
jgi:hypothetical protein